MKRCILILFILLSIVLFSSYTTTKTIAADEIPGPIVISAAPKSLC